MILERVTYFKENTPKEDREYRVGRTGPVGTIKEIALSFPHLEKEFTVWERCPLCKSLIEPGMGALSRKDNNTMICSLCGTEEGLGDYLDN